MEFGPIVQFSPIFDDPVIVNEKSTVLKGHCEKSNAGLFYGNFDEFENIINLFLKNFR